MKKPKKDDFKIKLTQDIVFQYFFKNDKEVLKDMLEAFLPLPSKTSIQEVSILDSQSLISLKQSKRVIFDIKAKLSTGERINIEMQKYTPTLAFKKRVLFYLSRLYSEHLDKGNQYEKVTPAYSLIFTTHDLFKTEFKDFYSEFFMARKKTPYVKWSEEFGIILVELNKLKKTNPEDLVDLKEKWCYFIRSADEKKKSNLDEISKLDQQMNQAVTRFKEMTRNEALRREAEFLEKVERDTNMYMDHYKEEGLRLGFEKCTAEGIAQGMKQGIKQGAEQGLKQGLEQGLKQGVEQGIEKNRQAVVLNMLKEKADITFISKVTGLSKEEILKIKNTKLKD